MYVNIVTVKSGWILQKIAERISTAGNRAGLGEFSVSHYPQIGADVNFYCDVQNCYGGPTSSIDIGLFTHVHANEITNVNPVTYKLDYIFHMSRKYMDMFADKNLYSASQMSLMVPWEIPAGFELKKPTIGIFQRGKYEGKGFDRMKTLFSTSTAAKHFYWLFVGNDWEEVIALGLKEGIKCRQLKDSEVTYPTGYSNLYDMVDYVLIPSEWEGGPICALEAMAKGLRVISADVGWVKDIGIIQVFKNTQDLNTILYDIHLGLWGRRNLVKSDWFGGEEISYKQCARQIVKAAEKL